MTPLATLALTRGIARLLERFDNGPGATVGVVQDGALAVHRSAGLASLELGVPIGPETAFRVASVTKQFTCAAILMLADEGRLRLDDDARLHLPELPDMGAPVTVAHLMRNTSGIRDMLGIQRMGGADLGQPVRPDQLMDGILRQRTLNFTPGSRFLYSNSNFLLLGRIVERLSNEPLAAVLDRRLLTPAGMTRSRLVEQVTAVVPGLATGYLQRDGAWVRAPHAFPLHGEGGLVSCVEDLALWNRWLDATPALAAALAQETPFTNGHPSLYAHGQVVRDYRGVPTIGHGGLWPGYRTEFLRVPGEGLAVIAISNRGDTDTSLLAHQVLDLTLDGRPGAAPAPASPAAAVTAPLAGRWLDRDAGATLDITPTEDGNTAFTTYGLSFVPSVQPDGRLGTVRGMTPFALRPNDAGTLEVEMDAGHAATYHRVPDGPALPDGLAGAYRSDELAATWTLAISETGLQVTTRGPVVSGGPWRIEAIEGDVIRIHVPDILFPSWLDASVLRGGTGRVEGLSVSGGRVKDVLFRRVAA
ncbi:MAG TPA: serine hydrolase domain-containing protein [Acetobacteraceae bacterium]